MKQKKKPFYQYTKGDVRRLLLLIAAIDHIERPTMHTLSQFLGCSNANVAKSVEKITEQLDVTIVNLDSVYRIKDWGVLLNKKSVRNILHSKLK